ncbi:MAG TPA: ABC transporter ATP-binding protein [Candidatus Mediterraneibacter cottocaccae]|nr:ABC transporter ATP-binding protein [Candidatus Mediterraneibacter cottocaccae]
MSKIQIKNVTKRYGDVTALDHVSFSFESGKIYGFLGRNGAGKSTLINIIANRIFPDEGAVFIDGLPARENMDVHEKIFCMSEADLYDTGMKVRDHFKWTGRFYDSFDVEKAFRIAEEFGLDTGKRFKALSKGYQSIFKLTIALALNVPYVIFDEPVLGLDANHREMFYSLLLKEFEENERTLIIATHLIEEVANIIEEVVLIDNGRVLLQESTEELLETGYCVSGFAKDVDAYCLEKNVIGTDELGSLKLAYICGEKTEIPQGSSLQITAMNLQKLFVKLTGKAVDGNAVDGNAVAEKGDMKL